jgi:hypothetical protein
MSKTRIARIYEQVDEDCYKSGCEPVGYIEAGDVRNGPGASAVVCDRPLHREAAKAYVEEVAKGQPGTFYPFGPRSDR